MSPACRPADVLSLPVAWGTALRRACRIGRQRWLVGGRWRPEPEPYVSSAARRHSLRAESRSLRSSGAGPGRPSERCAVSTQHGVDGMARLDSWIDAGRRSHAVTHVARRFSPTVRAAYSFPKRAELQK